MTNVLSLANRLNRDLLNYGNVFDFVDDFRGREYDFKTDVVEKDDCIEIYADMPGVKKEEVSISAENGILTIGTNRTEEKLDQNEHYVRRERKSGSVTRSFSLGKDIDAESISANLLDGVLKITAKKTEKSLPRKISIT